ncbi:unnamed protein product [Phaedon cochleariae]|uniref:Uncharacterized protein n=1 Tax=Phaedon cochleariae TaxID=80249 RepID=A0A9N9SFB4_PHACE|nr:unnamed protein product [Phaedon cochleariae]
MRQLVLVFVVLATAAALPASLEEQSSQKDVETIGLNNIGETSARPEKSLEETVEDYVKENEVSFELPFVGSKITMGARNLDKDELNFKLNFGRGSEVEARKKSKIKKAFIPILIFILVKAMILIPLALAILGFKTWNAIQLAFVSFVTSAALAIWKICTKVSHDHHPAIIHGGWDPHLDRTDAQQLAYSGYAPLE